MAKAVVSTPSPDVSEIKSKDFILDIASFFIFYPLYNNFTLLWQLYHNKTKS